MATVTLRVRENEYTSWKQNLSTWGWKVRDPADGAWIQMGPWNTKVRSADNTVWHDTK